MRISKSSRGFPFFWYLQEVQEGDRRGSNPRPSLEPHSDVTRSSLSYCVRLFGSFTGFSAISRNVFVCCVLACASKVAVNNTRPHGDPEPVPGTHRSIVCALSGPGLCGILHTYPRAVRGAWPRSCSGGLGRRFWPVRTGAMQDLAYDLLRIHLLLGTSVNKGN